MRQLRLVWSCNNFEPASRSTKKRQAKCSRLRTNSSTRLSLSKKCARLEIENPAAAAVIERLVNRALAELGVKVV